MRILLRIIGSIFCFLFGHSRIQDAINGYFFCGRCRELLGNNKKGVYSEKDLVIIGHQPTPGKYCKPCLENYKKMTWKDKFLVPYPFGKKK